MKRISVLIPDAEVRLPVACCLAQSRQAVVHGLARQPALSTRGSKFFASFENPTAELPVEEWLQRIECIVTEHHIDVVLPISDFAIRTLSERREGLAWAAKLPLLPDPQTLDVATNKAKLAEFLKRRGLPHPPTAVMSGGMTADDVPAALEFPVLAKPPSSMGGIGIVRLDNRRALADFLAAQPRERRWVVQTQIEGNDLGINVLCRDGRILAATAQHAIKRSLQPFHWPAGIELGEDPAAMSLAEKLVRELGWSGVANIDMRFDARQKIPLLLELNGRYWFTLLGSLNAGVNFPLLACETCLGEIKANRIPQRTRYFVGRESVLLSLVGGGSLRIMPRETNLRYFDPLPTALASAESATAALRTAVSRLMPKTAARRLQA